MSRVPTLSVNEAATLIGPAPVVTTIENRSNLRKWFVARGCPSLAVARLSSAELAEGYNNEDVFTMLSARMANEPFGPTNGHAMPAPAPQPAAASSSEDTTALISTLRALIGASVDETKVRSIVASMMTAQDERLDALENEPRTNNDMVRAIVKDMLASVAPVTKIEVTRPDGTEYKPEGAVHNTTPKLIKLAAQRLHVWLAGPAGSGKTTACEQVAKALGLPFYFSGQMTGSHELTGFVDGHGRYQTTPFRQAYEHGGVFLADECDGSDPAVPNTLNAALANGQMSFPDRAEPVQRHPDFVCFAAANTYGRGADRVYVGRNQLDGAFLDRFIFVAFDYDEKLEMALAGNEGWTNRVQELRRGAFKVKAQIVISPRASIHGAKLLASGFERDDVAEMTIWKGVDKALRDKIEAAI